MLSQLRAIAALDPQKYYAKQFPHFIARHISAHSQSTFYTDPLPSGSVTMVRKILNLDIENDVKVKGHEIEAFRLAHQSVGFLFVDTV